MGKTLILIESDRMLGGCDIKTFMTWERFKDLMISCTEIKSHEKLLGVEVNKNGISLIIK